MSKVEIGNRFGRLVVLKSLPPSVSPSGKKRTRWLCQCECGAVTEVLQMNLVNGHTPSCGCLCKEVKINLNTTHGWSNTRLYRIWGHMRQRCSNPNAPRYDIYGGRGIKVCEDWKEFQFFKDWSLSHGYSDDLTIDRIDNDGDYCPQNCRWTSVVDQANNRRTNVHIAYNGEKHTIAEWARILDINTHTLRNRLRAGIPPEKAFAEASR